MKNLTITFSFSEKKLGKDWFNINNLKLMLYSKIYTKKELLKCKQIKKVK